MANPNWIKGISGNPSGRPGRPKELLNCTREELQKVMWRLWQLQPEALAAIGAALKENVAPIETQNAGEVWLASVLAQGIKQGDAMRLEWWLTRMIGKPLNELHDDEFAPKGLAPLISIEKAKEILAGDYATQEPPEITVRELDLEGSA
jgi:hypothetical protein